MTIKNHEFKEKSQVLRNAVDYSQGSVVSKTIVDKKSGTVTLFAFDQGQKLSEHTAPFDALVLIVEGEGEIIINQKSYLMGTGSMILMPAHKPHAVNASKKFKMLLIMIKD